jgi:lipopolysaccharide heptosyltransferase II
MSLTAISSLAEKYPPMSLWSNSRVSGLIPVFFPSLEVYTESRLKGIGFTKLLLMTDSFRSALQGFMSAIPERIGYGTDMRSLLLTKAIIPPSDRCHHHSADYRYLASEIGASGDAVIPEPSVEAQGFSHIAFFAGARYGSAKRWSRFPELARHLCRDTGLQAVFYGSREEEEVLSAASSEVPGSFVRTDLTLQGLVSHLLSAVLTVGNDSGGVHVSAALGIPTVTVFGSSSPVWTAPMGSFTETVKSDRLCSPCFKRRCPYGSPECLNDISTEAVLAACANVMKKTEVPDY